MRLTGKYALDLLCPMRSRSSNQNISVRYNTVQATWVYLCLEQGFLQPDELAHCTENANIAHNRCFFVMEYVSEIPFGLSVTRLVSLQYVKLFKFIIFGVVNRKQM